MSTFIQRHYSKIFLVTALFIFAMLALWIQSIELWTGRTPMLVGTVTLIALMLLWIIFLLIREVQQHTLIANTSTPAEDHFRVIWEQSRDGMRLMNYNGKVLLVNSAYCNLVERTKKEILEEIISGTPFDIETLPTEQILHKNNGEELIVELTHTGITSSSGEKLILSVFRDVTNRKKVEQEMLETKKMDALGRFALEIANSFNNIVGIVLNAAEVLKAKFSSDSAGREFLDMIIAHANRGGKFATDLLVFTRSHNPEEREVSIPKSLEHSKKMLEYMFPKNITVSLSLGDNDAVIMGDIYETHQAIVNVGLSAQERMPNGGKISITSFLMGEDDVKLINSKALEMQYVVIIINDNGTPLTDEQKQTIFEPRFIATDHHTSTGLRLAVVYSITKRQYGFVRVESDSTNGTTFSLYFPVARHGDIAYEVEQPYRAIEGKNVVLVVDDEDAYRVLYEREFMSYGFTVMLAKDGDEAMHVYNQYGDLISLVVTDITMPKMNGEELYKKLISKNPDVKVIFATGNIDVKSRTELLNLGVKGIVEKPFTFAELMSTVKRVMEA